MSLQTVPFDVKHTLWSRVRRLANASPFVGAFDPELVEEIRRLAATTRFDFVFLNQEVLASLAPLIRPFLPKGCRIVVLSHGLESTDLLHIIRLHRKMPLSHRLWPTPALLIGRILVSEQQSRPDVDAVCAISPFDADLERWLGMRRVGWIPRLVTPQPLAWRPVEHRLGFVGTLDHAPNLEGLVDVLDELAKEPASPLRLRIVGDGQSIGRWLQSRYKNVEVLGALDDPALEAEAASWTAFLHPIFSLPRGCSTKLATGIAWQIPIVTTPEGRRGYVWDDGALLEAETPAQFVGYCKALGNRDYANEVQQDVVRVSQSGPTLAAVATQMRDLIA